MARGTVPSPSNDQAINPREKPGGIFESSLLLFRDVLQNLYGEKIPVDYAVSDEEARKVFLIQGKMPSKFFALKVLAVSEYKDSYNTTVSSKDGWKLAQTSDGHTIAKLKFKPMLVELEISFCTHDWRSKLLYSERFILRERKMTFDLAMNNTKPYISIQVLSDAEMSFEDVNFDQENEGYQKLSHNVRLITYASEIHRIPIVAKNIIRGYVANKETVDEYTDARLDVTPLEAFNWTLVNHPQSAELPTQE